MLVVELQSIYGGESTDFGAMSMRKTVLLAMMGGACIPVQAFAQSGSDLIVMRRVIARPLVSTTAPTPTPTPTPAPTPTPTPTQTPTPTPAPVDQPTRNVQKIATQALVQTPQLPYPTTGKPSFSGNLSLSTNAGGIRCRDNDTGQMVDDSLCDGLPNPAGVGTITVPATYNTAYRTVVFDQAAVKGQNSTLQTVQCSGSATFPVTGGNPETWKYSCDPSSVSARYAKFITNVSYRVYAGYRTYAENTGGAPERSDVLTAIGGSMICRDTRTNTTVLDGYCNNVATPAYPADISVKAHLVPNRRRAYIDPTALLAAYPYMDMATACSSHIPVALKLGSYDPTEDWRTTCNPEDVRDHHERVIIKPSLASGINPYGATSRNGARMERTWEIEYTTNNPNDHSGIVQTEGTACRDKDTGMLTTSGYECSYHPKPVGAQVKVVFEPKLRLIYVDINDLNEKYPYAIPLGNWTTQMFTSDGPNLLYAGAETEYWHVTVNPELIRIHHQLVVYNGYTSTFIVPSGRLAKSGSPYTAMLRVNAPSLAYMACMDTDPNVLQRYNTKAEESRCKYMTPPQGTYDVPATLDPSTQKYSIKLTDLRALMPHLTFTTSICSSLSVRGSDGDVSYNGTCS